MDSRPFNFSRISPKVDLIPCNNIIYFEGSGNYSIIHFNDKSRPELVSKTLKFFDERLPNCVRISKQFIVNPPFIEQVIHFNYRAVRLKMINGAELTVSRRRIASLKDVLKDRPDLDL